MDFWEIVCRRFFVGDFLKDVFDSDNIEIILNKFESMDLEKRTEKIQEFVKRFEEKNIILFGYLGFDFQTASFYKKR